MEKLLRWKNYPKNNFVKKISLIENYCGRRKCGKIKKIICSNYLAVTRLFNIIQFPILFYFLMTECSKNKISFTWILPCFRQFCDMTLSWVFDLTNYLFFPMTKYSNNNSILLLPILLFYLFPATFEMHARNERRESVESTRYGSTSRRIARNRLISFANGDEKLARSYSYPSQVFPSRIHRGSRSILFYRPLEEMRGRC